MKLPKLQKRTMPIVGIEPTTLNTESNNLATIGYDLSPYNMQINTSKITFSLSVEIKCEKF